MECDRPEVAHFGGGGGCGTFARHASRDVFGDDVGDDVGGEGACEGRVRSARSNERSAEFLAFAVDKLDDAELRELALRIRRQHGLRGVPMSDTAPSMLLVACSHRAVDIGYLKRALADGRQRVVRGQPLLRD